MTPALIIARTTLLEARRGGLPWLALAALVATVALTGFLAEVAITEREALQASVAAALLRAMAVFLVGAHVVTSLSRESSDKGLEFVLAFAISRPAWYAGRLAGFCAVAALLAIAFSAPLLAWGSFTGVTAWAASLALEASLVAAMAFFFCVSLSHPAGAISATAALYVLGRSIGAVSAIAAGPHAAEGAFGEFSRLFLDAIGLLLPDLEAMTRAAWIAHEAPAAAELGRALAVAAAYLVVVLAAGLFDFGRRNL